MVLTNRMVFTLKHQRWWCMIDCFFFLFVVYIHVLLFKSVCNNQLCTCVRFCQWGEIRCHRKQRSWYEKALTCLSEMKELVMLFWRVRFVYLLSWIYFDCDTLSLCYKEHLELFLEIWKDGIDCVEFLLFFIAWVKFSNCFLWRRFLSDRCFSKFHKDSLVSVQWSV